MTVTPQAILAGMIGTPFPIQKAAFTAEGNGAFHSLWKVGGLPGVGSNPPLFSAGSGYVPTRLTPGAYPFPNPVTGNTYLARLACFGPVDGTFILYDRAWACSGLSANTTSVQNIVTPGDVGRYTNFQGIEIFGEVYTAPGATGGIWQVGYTNQSGTSGRIATYTHPTNAETANQAFPFQMQAGDTGAQSVQSFQCLTASGVAGDIGITLVRRLGESGIPRSAIPQNALDTANPRVLDDACLAGMVLCSATAQGATYGSFSLSQLVP